MWLPWTGKATCCCSQHRNSNLLWLIWTGKTSCHSNLDKDSSLVWLPLTGKAICCCLHKYNNLMCLVFSHSHEVLDQWSSQYPTQSNHTSVYLYEHSMRDALVYIKALFKLCQSISSNFFSLQKSISVLPRNYKQKLTFFLLFIFFFFHGPPWLWGSRGCLLFLCLTVWGRGCEAFFLQLFSSTDEDWLDH